MLAADFDSDDLVMIVSDHGFEAGVGMGNLTGIHNSDEAIDGILFARGRDIPAGQRILSVSVTDVTPTILAWLGLPIADDMDGKPAGFLQTPAKKTIATYETGPVERLAVTPSGGEDEMLDQLEALGYFEGE
jgi:arylsulfatase A-like enzyme